MKLNKKGQEAYDKWSGLWDNAIAEQEKEVKEDECRYKAKREGVKE